MNTFDQIYDWFIRKCPTILTASGAFLICEPFTYLSFGIFFIIFGVSIWYERRTTPWKDEQLMDVIQQISFETSSIVFQEYLQDMIDDAEHPQEFDPDLFPPFPPPFSDN